ncbi:hypothetical protein Glove_52g53 [Diversispora epigaea]|uniref:Uncharacterized protein n=1 Tax=Diversispora epigaea TaxID=1348612 RepID=A0A397JE80_9GLOM|nr:hypothetical protein Glove_52g53 [Diversispora epigaea]
MFNHLFISIEDNSTHSLSNCLNFKCKSNCIISERGTKIKRQRLGECLRRIDLFRITAQWAEPIPCRRYQVAGPNAL